LPEAVGVFSLKTFGFPRLSWLGYRMVQTCFADCPLNLVVVDGEAFEVEAARDLVGTPFDSFPYFDSFLFECIFNFWIGWPSLWLFL